jgi:chromosome segregation ATPase
MKVKITKTIDAGDVPAECRKMIDLAKNTLVYSLPNVMSEALRFSLSSNGQEFFHTLTLIESLREDLGSLDEQLQEVHGIMQTYRDYLTKVAQEDEAREKEKEQSDTANRAEEKQRDDEKIRNEIESYVESKRTELEDMESQEQQYSEEWLHREQAEYEKRIAQSDVGDPEDYGHHHGGTDEEG